MKITIPLNAVIAVINSAMNGKSFDNFLYIILEMFYPYNLINFGAWWGIQIEGNMRLGW